MRTVATLSLFTLAPALLTPAGALAQEQTIEPRPWAPDAGVTDPSQLPEPYQPPPDPYETAADPAQVDWPQDLAPEEAAVDSYDDGYDPQAYTQFQDELSPYGDWIDDASYGRVWMPASSIVGADFTPYDTGGHWLLTEFGWTWVSDWSWGWAPFHYGRWIFLGYGWCWVPGTIWGPAWVSWRFGGGYAGWAALPPRGISVTVTYGHRSPWRFTHASDLGAKRLRCLPMRDTRGLFHRTSVIANDRVLTRGTKTVHTNAGPRYIANATPVRLRDVAPHTFPQRAILPRPGVNMYARPWIRAANAGGASASGAALHPGGGGVVGHTPGGGGGGVGHTPGGGFAPRAAATPPPRVYNPPRSFGAPSIQGAPQTFGPPARANGVERVHGPAFTNSAPRVYNVPPTNNPRQMYTAPPSYGPPRTLATSPAVNPTRTFAPPVQVYSPPPRTFAPPAVQRAPMQPMHRAFTPPPVQAAPQRSFSPPAFSAPAGGGFGRAGGGMHFGGGHRR